MKTVRILVLGVGGNVSQGILKAIYHSGIPCLVVGACISPDSPGLYWCDTAYVCPYASDAAFIPWLIDTCNREDIDIVLSGVEENIMAISAASQVLAASCRAAFVIGQPWQLQTGLDKLATCKWLKANGCNYPAYCASGDQVAALSLVEQYSYPLIAKPRRGKGSGGILLLHDKDELLAAAAKPDYVLQQYLGSEDSEYTVGCYRGRGGADTQLIIMKRILQNGATWKATVVDQPVVEAEARRICAAFKPVGPLNIQMRLDSNSRAVCFELNVRFSGTTPMRSHFGFCDVEAAIREYALKEEDISSCFAVRHGTAYRFTGEMYLDAGLDGQMSAEGRLSGFAAKVSLPAVKGDSER